jgi:hypothetical protein
MLKLSAKSIVSTPCFLIFLLPLFKLLFRPLKSERETFMISFYDLKWKDRLHVVLIFAFQNFQNR